MVIPSSFAQTQAGGVQKEGTWYVGEGLKHGDFFSYSMCFVDYKECAQFEMDMWIKGDIQSGSETKWLAEVVIYDGNKIIVGEMEMGKVAPEPTGGTENLSVYRGAFKSSIAWLSAFATSDGSAGGKGPKEFSSVSWGKIGNIGGEQVIPKSLETISITSGTWETILISWRTGGSTSNVWIVDNFPFPVKASTLTHVSEGIPPPEYEFELLDYKENVLQSPFEGIIPTKDKFLAMGCDTNIQKTTSIKKSTYNYHYQVYVFYGPEDPVQGCELELTIKFISKFDDTEFLNQVQYDFLVVDDNLTPLRSIAQEEGRNFLYSPSGLASLDFVVKEEPGNTHYVIWIYGMAPKGVVPNPLETPADYLEITIPIFANDNIIIVTPPAKTMPEVQPTTEIQSWIKTSVGYWADGVSSDAEFISAIQFLINEGIIQIPPTIQGTGETTEIQSWIKTSVGYWADGVSSDAEFISAIQFLIKEGILSISS